MTITNDTYIAWALYTGPSDVTPLWKNSRWIMGQWVGANADMSPEQIKIDIDERIGYLVKTFLQAREKSVYAHIAATRHWFAIPEFFFHGRQGPYPEVMIGDKYPYEYICLKLKNEIAKLSSELNNEVWLFCIGSVLTCNEPNISDFLSSSRVQERQNALNEEMSGFNIANRLDSLALSPRIKAFSYLSMSDPVSETEKRIDELMTHYRANPLCIVRNRGALLVRDKKGVGCFGYEKQNESTVDLTMGMLDEDGMLSHGGMITEWMAGYPSISIYEGDKNTKAAPLAARMSVPYSIGSVDSQLQIGVEICLDHRLKRLRRTVGMTKKNGAAADNPPLAIQLIPSGGMQILDASVSSGVGGVIFNCDGCDPILTEYNENGEPVISDSGTFKKITCGVYASSAQTMVPLEKPYYSHSQLAFRYGNHEIPGYDNAKGNNNVNGATSKDPQSSSPSNPLLDAYDMAERIPVNCINGQSLYPAGLGELHLYRKSKR
ncbi:MAG: hypothetical protein PHQ34_09075 [Methanothrix sp.]|nr:hypothetical protein [Methanothrix sp.]